MGIVEYGAAVSNPLAMKAYIDTLDPGFWIVRAGAEKDAARAEDMLRLAGHLESLGLHERQNRVFRRLYKDFTVLEAALASMAGADGPLGCARLVDDRAQAALALLHAVRIAVVHEVFLLAMRVPEFSSRHNLTLRRIVLRLLHLDAPAVVKLLEEIFPVAERPADAEDFGEPATYRGDAAQSYTFENERIFRPIRGLSVLIRRISTAATPQTGRARGRERVGLYG